jgi:cytochrome P450
MKVLRAYPAQMVSRTAVADFEIRGQSIRAGDSVLAAVGSANRDPEAFADPDRLDVGRHPNDHLAFGLGIHFCPGAALSRIEARAAIPGAARAFPSYTARRGAASLARDRGSSRSRVPARADRLIPPVAGRLLLRALTPATALLPNHGEPRRTRSTVSHSESSSVG